MSRSRRAWTTRLPIVLLLAMCGAAGSAHAAVPFKEIASGGPLTSVTLGDELSCQVAHAGDAGLELFPSAAKPGDCGTFVFAAGTLFAPNFAAHDSTSTSALGASTPFTPVSQSPVGGAGSSASPFKVTTVADAGASGLRISQSDSYVVGQESYRTDTTISNGGPAPADRPSSTARATATCRTPTAATASSIPPRAPSAARSTPRTSPPGGSSSGIR